MNAVFQTRAQKHRQPIIMFTRQDGNATEEEGRWEYALLKKCFQFIYTKGFHETDLGETLESTPQRAIHSEYSAMLKGCNWSVVGRKTAHPNKKCFNKLFIK